MKKRLVRESLFALGLIGIARLFSLVKEIAVADILGLGENLDHFIYAFLVINFFSRFLFNTLSIALVPELTKQLNDSSQKANELFNRVVLIGTVAAIGLLIIWLVFDDFILDLLVGNSEAILVEKIRRYILYFFPYILLYFWVYSVGQYLTIHGKKLFLAWHLVPSMLFVISFLYFRVCDDPVTSMISGYIAGLGLALIVCVLELMKHSWRFKVVNQSSGHKLVLNQWKILILAELLVAVNLVVDQTMAAAYPPGQLSGLDYGLKIFINICALFYMLINLSYFPYFSQLISSNKFIELKKSSNWILMRLAFVLGTISIVLIMFDDEIIRILFERGKFRENDTILVSQMMTAYMIALFFNVGNFLFIRMLTALQQVQSVLMLSMISVVLNVVLNIVFTEYYGLVGLAYSSTLVSILAFIFLFMVSRKKISTMIALNLS